MHKPGHESYLSDPFTIGKYFYHIHDTIDLDSRWLRDIEIK